MIRFADERGVPLERCIAGTGLCGDDLVDPAREITGQQELSVLRNICRALGPDVSVGLLCGERYRFTMFGMWGLVAATSATLGEALESGLRYFDLSYSFNRVRFELQGTTGRLVYDDSDNPEDLRAALVERDLAALIALERELLGRTIPAKSLQLRAGRPRYAEAFVQLFRVAPRFGAAANVLSFDATWLTKIGPLADAAGHSVCVEQCRALVAHRNERVELSHRVRARLLRVTGAFPTMRAVAHELGMSTRTLRNQLQREDVSYRSLVDGVRSARAEELLLSTDLTVAEVAERLGYADSSSFVSAFKRWKGVPPSDYRGRPGD
jgi:AraC-like DNA-binding protein